MAVANLPRMLSWLSRARTPDPELDRLRNAAVQDWIRVFPEERRLATFLDGIDPTRRRAVARAARAVVRATEAFPTLRAARNHADAEAWQAALRDHLTARFPWMSEETFAALKLYSDWSSWR